MLFFCYFFSISSVKAWFCFDSTSQHVISEPFEPSPFMPGAPRAFDNDFNVMPSRQQKGQTEADSSVGFLTNEKENTRENNVAKIKVVVCHSILNWLLSYSCIFKDFVEIWVCEAYKLEYYVPISHFSVSEPENN